MRNENEQRRQQRVPLPHYSHNQKYLWSAIFVLEIRIWDLRAAAAIFRGNHHRGEAARAPLLLAAAATVSCLSVGE